MSAANPPCVAELTFMRVLPAKLADMTEAMIKLAAAMDRHSAALERQNELQVTVQNVTAPISPELLERAVMEDRRG